jgi:hypothetical protein
MGFKRAGQISYSAIPYANLLIEPACRGATTFSITALGITTLSIMALGVLILGKTST